MAPRKEWLEPVFVDFAGRDGSTLMMRLLATSPEVAVEPEYPYEQKYLTYLRMWTQLLDSTHYPDEVWNEQHMASLALGEEEPWIGPPMWWPRQMFDPPAGEKPMSARAFDLIWAEFSHRATLFKRAFAGNRKTKVRYYAEKQLLTWKADLSDLPAHRILAVVRDPRDVWVSIRAVNERRENTDLPRIGRDREETEEGWRSRFVDQQRERIGWISTLDPSQIPIFRYEDMVLDLPSQARRLSEWLETPIDPEAVLNDVELWKEHSSSASRERSVGRWRSEMSREEAESMSAALAPELEALSYEPS